MYSPLLSGKTAVSPAVKSKVRALESPMKMVARASPWWKYSHSSAYRNGVSWISTLGSLLKASVTVAYVRVPMKLAQALGLELHNSSSNGL